MNQDTLSDALRRHVDRIAPPIALEEVEERQSPVVRAAMPPGPRWTMVVAAVLIVVAAVGGLVLARQSGPGPDDGAVEEGSTTSVPDATPQGPTAWPELITARPNRPQVLRVDPATGEVIDRFAPASLQYLDGATGAPDGRIAAWAGGRVAIQDGATTYETELDRTPGLDPASNHALRVVLVPGAPVAWIRDGTQDNTTIWRWDYREGDPVLADVDPGPGLFPAGVTDGGRLVLSSSGRGGLVIALGPVAAEPLPTTLDGVALAVHRDRILVQHCPTGPDDCVLTSVDADTGESVPVDTGDVDPGRVRDLLGPVIPSDSAPLPTGDPGSARVLVRVDVGPRVVQDQPVAIGFVDLDAGVLTVTDTESQDGLAAVAWSCDGSDLLVFGLQDLRSVSGDIAATLPEDTFLYGIGPC